MAKKNNPKGPSMKQQNELTDSILPQNIIELGEHEQEDKKIYISQATYKEIHRFTQDKTTNESGGVLLGNVIEEFGKVHIVIRAFIEAKHCEGTPTTLKFTHETWEYIHKEADKKYPSYKILGWIHTHPNFGIFLSEYDKFIQDNFFNEENQVAYVVDPIQKIEGFYFWINGKIEKCKGFYVFDRTNVKINITTDNKTQESNAIEAIGISRLKDVLIGSLTAVVILLLVLCLNSNRRINTLEDQMRTLVDSANASIGNLYNNINSIDVRLTALEPSSNEMKQETSSTEANPVATEIPSSATTPTPTATATPAKVPSIPSTTIADTTTNKESGVPHE